MASDKTIVKKEVVKCPVCWAEKLKIVEQTTTRIHYKCKCGCTFSVLREE